MKPFIVFVAVISGSLIWNSGQAAQGNPQRGAQVFRACMACHSLVSDRNMTGPSLAALWGRKAGSLKSFPRYSDALKSSGVVWDAKTLDEWLKNPQAFIPGNEMTFPGIPNDRQRADLIAFLEVNTRPGSSPSAAERGRPPMNLKTLSATQQVKSIRYCGDTYTVTTLAGRVLKFWEFNLRFKTDSSANGPPKDKPALLHGGMMGDRAFVVFASPADISGFIKPACRGAAPATGR
jgi:cytochrome c